MKTIILSEEQEQIVFIQYLELMNIKYSAIAHSTFTTSWAQKNKNKRMGLKKGVPDILILLKNKIVFVEMKRIRGGIVSKEQQEWINAINNIADNIEAKICKGADEAINYIKQLNKLT